MGYSATHLIPAKSVHLKLARHAPAKEEVSLRGESGESNPGAANFVAHIQSDQQRG